MRRLAYWSSIAAGSASWQRSLLRSMYAHDPRPNAKRETVLDFNKAYNPPCAYNPYTTCPLPTAQNQLKVRIEAGELDYHKQH